MYVRSKFTYPADPPKRNLIDLGMVGCWLDDIVPAVKLYDLVIMCRSSRALWMKESLGISEYKKAAVDCKTFNQVDSRILDFQFNQKFSFLNPPQNSSWKFILNSNSFQFDNFFFFDVWQEKVSVFDSRSFACRRGYETVKTGSKWLQSILI